MEKIEKEVKEEVKNVETKKVIRRGIGSARGTTRLTFNNDLAKNNGLFIGHLDSVVVSMAKIGEDTTGMPSFNGLEIPKIVFTFATNEDTPNKRHYVTLSFMCPESNVDTIPGGKDEWKVNMIFDWLKHILDVFVFKGRELTEEEENILSLPFMDFDENGEYVPVEVEEVIAGWKTLFENVENVLNKGNEDKPYFKSKDGKYLPIWIKLIRFYKNNKKGWQPVSRGDLAFPTYVGQGCIELFKQNTIPTIKLDMVKETILIMNVETKTAKAPNMTNVGGAMPAMGGVPVGDPMTSAPMPGGMPDVMGITNDAGNDMPF